MSKDYNVFIKAPIKINASDFEFYAFSHGYPIRIYPLTDYLSHKGFLPFNIYPSFIEQKLPYDSLVSGFELYSWPYEHEKDGEEFNRNIPNTNYQFMISISSGDSFEELCALLFAGYLSKYFGGVLYDPQKDRFFFDQNSIKAKLEEERSRLSNLAAQNCLLIHKFDGWK